VRREKDDSPTFSQGFFGLVPPDDANLGFETRQKIQKGPSEMAKDIVYADGTAAEGLDHIKISADGSPLSGK